MGRRRRYRSRETSDQLELEQLKESRRAAYLEKQLGKEHEEQVDASNGVKAAEREIKLECAAILRNIPKTMTASEVVQALIQRAGFQDEIIKCRILTESGMHQRSMGSAEVVFKTPAAFQKVTDMCQRGFRIQGMEISIKEKKNWQRGGSRADCVKTFAVITMHLCAGDRDLHSLEPSVVRWSCSRDVSLQINPRIARQVAIEFNGQFRIEFPLKSIRQSRLLQNAEGRQVYRFRLGGPPHVFVRESSEAHHVSGMLATVLRGMKTDKRFWELGAGNSADHKWERTIDPSGFSAFGHCLVYELVLGQSPFDLIEVLSQFSITPPIVPGIVSAPIETEAFLTDGNWSGGYDDVFESLPFPIQYMLHACIASHKLCLRNRQAAQALYDALTDPDLHPEKAVEELENWYFDGYPTRFHELLENLSQAAEPDSQPELLEKDPRRGALTRRVLITPLRICPLPLDVDSSNRVLRSFWRYRDRFLRVNFCDEDFGSVMQVVRSPDVMERRIRHFVNDGIVIGGRRFVFLAYSNSQLREQSCWMYDEDYRPDDDDDDFPSADEIRTSIGDLSHISVVGKHAARLAQAFSSTTAAVRMVDWQYEMVDDVERNGFCFSDGCGVLSPTLAEKIAAELSLPAVPSAFQIRFAGSKGIVGVRPYGAINLPDVDLVLRRSMTKFVANEAHRDLEICNYSKVMPCYLNRQIIVLLSSLGVSDRSFLDLADAMLKSMDHAMTDYDSCCEMVRDNAPGSVADRMLDAGIKPENDRHLWELVHALRDRLLMDVQTKARIYVHHGVTLYGLMDETGLLEPDEVFFQQSDPPMMLPPGTLVAVGRSPCLHPGDIRLLRTSDCPELSNLYDVVVFSQKGERPQPNMMSGGDLDGDIYFIIWDETLLPTEEFPPMDYTAPSQQPVSVSDQVDVTHIQDFFVNYMKNDNLGRIANAHVVFADCAEDGAKSAECLMLAELHSIAVDFGKTGVPAVLPKELFPHAYPDFMEKETKTSYDSKKVIGKIYRKARGRHFKPFPPLSNGYDERFLVSGYEEFVDNAKDLFISYSNSLWDIAQRFECYDEGELVSGFVRSLTKKLARTRDVTGVDTVQQLTMQVEHMMEGYREEFWSDLDRDITNPESFQRSLAKASAWYHVAYDQGFSEEYDKPFLSFAWIATPQMCAIVQSVLGDRQE